MYLENLISKKKNWAFVISKRTLSQPMWSLCHVEGKTKCPGSWRKTDGYVCCESNDSSNYRRRKKKRKSPLHLTFKICCWYQCFFPALFFFPSITAAHSAAYDTNFNILHLNVSQSCHVYPPIHRVLNPSLSPLFHPLHSSISLTNIFCSTFIFSPSFRAVIRSQTPQHTQRQTNSSPHTGNLSQLNKWLLLFFFSFLIQCLGAHSRWI